MTNKELIEKKVNECIELVNSMMVFDDVWTPNQRVSKLIHRDPGPSLAEQALSKLEDIEQLLNEEKKSRMT